MNKEFETWWNINKFRLMEDDNVGLREIALAAYLAGKGAAEQSVQRTVDQPCEHNMEFSSCFPVVVRFQPPLTQTVWRLVRKE